MSGSWPISVTSDGAVHLGPKVVVDGFRRSAPIRVQSHAHDDHLTHFNRSKARQDILTLAGTRDLLIARYNADLPNRVNLLAIPLGDSWQGIELVPNGHMLGSCQTEVTLPDGTRLGYSGDFSWPIERVIAVDYLVIDSTYGSPESIRTYTQGQAEVEFVGLVLDGVRQGQRVCVKSHPGTLQRGLSALHGRVDVPIIVSPRCKRESDVYRQYGYIFNDVLVSEGIHKDTVTAGARIYVRFLGPGDGGRSQVPDDARFIVTSGFMSSGNRIVQEYGDGRSFQVAMSDHADFNGTIEYVKATRAERVLVDNSRSGNAELLASILRSDLGVRALADVSAPEPWW